jgi:hypothetical protein
MGKTTEKDTAFGGIQSRLEDSTSWDVQSENSEQGDEEEEETMVSPSHKDKKRYHPVGWINLSVAGARGCTLKDSCLRLTMASRLKAYLLLLLTIQEWFWGPTFLTHYGSPPLRADLGFCIFSSKLASPTYVSL